MSDVMNSLLQEIREARDTHEFLYETGDKGYILTVKRFLPGTAMRLRNTSLIKLHKVVETEKALISEVTTEEMEAIQTARTERIDELNKRFCEAVLDIRHADEPAKPLEAMEAQERLSVEVAQELFPTVFKDRIVDWAMGGAVPPDPDNLTEGEAFPSVPE